MISTPLAAAVDQLRAKRPDVVVLSRPVGIAFEREWYEAMDADHFWMRWRSRAFLAQLRALGVPRDRRLRVLDVGCGHAVQRAAVEEASDWIVDGADVNPQALLGSRSARGATYLYDVRDRHSDLLGRYDAALLLDVLEHIEEPTPFLSAVAAHLRPGGLVFVNVPALPSLYSTFDTVLGHYRRYRRGTLVEELRRVSVDPLDVRYWGFGLLPLLVLRRLVLGRSRASEEAAAIARRGVDPRSRGVARLLKALMSVETAVLPRPPLGTSLLFAGRLRKG